VVAIRTFNFYFNMKDTLTYVRVANANESVTITALIDEDGQYYAPHLEIPEISLCWDSEEGLIDFYLRPDYEMEHAVLPYKADVEAVLEEAVYRGILNLKQL